MMLSMPRSLTITLVMVAALGLVPRPLGAQIYRWVDGAGVPHYSEGLDAVPERHRQQATPTGLRSAPATSDGAASPRTPLGAATLRYSPGQRILADVLINGTSSARLILDTGSDHTLINPRALAAAGVSLSRPVATGRIVGVTGSDQLPYVMIESLEVAGIRLGRMPVGAYGVADADGLLGRDVLDRFNVTIDATQGLITLSPK